jgi:hypothetical protein
MVIKLFHIQLSGSQASALMEAGETREMRKAGRGSSSVQKVSSLQNTSTLIAGCPSVAF